MDDDHLGNDLRDMFDRRMRGLGDTEELTRGVKTSGLDGGDQPSGRVQLITGFAAVAIAVLLIGTFIYIRSSGLLAHRATSASSARTATPARTTPPPSPSSTATPSSVPSPIVAGTGGPLYGNLIDAAPVDFAHGYALASNCNAAVKGTCAYWVQKTSDAGAHWSAPVHVGPAYASDDGAAPRHIVFVDAQTGFVYGYSGAFVTHDDGATWSHVDVKANFIESVATAGRLSWIVTYPCAKGTRCAYEVRWTADGGRTWSTPHSLPDSFYLVDVTAFPPEGLLVGGGAGAGATMTTDGGTTWTLIGARCTGTFTELNTTSDGTSLIKLCIDQPHGSTVLVVLYTSDNAGITWKEQQLPGLGPFMPECGFPFVLTSTGAAGSAVLASNLCTIALTRDGGVTWKETGPLGGRFAEIKFATPAEGWALDVHGDIWYTVDGGADWQSLSGIAVPPKPAGG